MSDGVKKPYVSQLRARQGRETRRGIIEAAAALFVAKGYGGTTIDDIAAAAGVGRKTVFNAVGGKPDCLQLAIDRAIAGDDEPVPIMQRPQTRATMQIEDARQHLRAYVEQYVQRAARAGALLEVLSHVAGLDETLKALHDGLEGQRTFGMTRLAEQLDLRRALRPELSVPDAAQLLLIHTDTAVHRRLVTRHGWPPDRFARWLAGTLVTQLIRADYEPRPRDLGIDPPP